MREINQATIVCSSYPVDSPMATEHFKAKDIGLRAQKKILSRMSSKAAVKVFIDDRSASILDNTYRLFKQYTGNKKEAEKLIKCIIKTVVKIGILHRNDQFNGAEMKIATKLRSNFHKLGMTVGSFYELDYSYDYAYLSRILAELHLNMANLVRNHLTEKSLNRINRVFEFCGRKDFQEAVFGRKSPYRETVTRIVNDLNTIIEEEDDN